MKVEVAVLGSPSLIVLNMLSVDVQHLHKKPSRVRPGFTKPKGQDMQYI